MCIALFVLDVRHSLGLSLYLRPLPCQVDRTLAVTAFVCTHPFHSLVGHRSRWGPIGTWAALHPPPDNLGNTGRSPRCPGPAQGGTHSSIRWRSLVPRGRCRYELPLQGRERWTWVIQREINVSLSCVSLKSITITLSGLWQMSMNCCHLSANTRVRAPSKLASMLVGSFNNLCGYLQFHVGCFFLSF